VHQLENKVLDIQPVLVKLYHLNFFFKPKGLDTD